MREDELAAEILREAHRFGWLGYHTHDSRRSEPGFPDLVLVRRGRILYRELKVSSRPSAVTAPQRLWLHELRDAGADVDVWTLADWPAHVMADLTNPGALPVRILPPRPTARELIVAREQGKARARARRRR